MPPPPPPAERAGDDDADNKLRDEAVREAVLEAAGMGLKEKEHMLEDLFKPGPIGLTYWPKTGLITEVFEGGQAQLHGVQVGWFVDSVAGEAYNGYNSHKTFVTYRHHDKPYKVTFVSKTDTKDILDLEELDLPSNNAGAEEGSVIRCTLSIPDGVRANAVQRNLEQSHRQGRLIDVCMNCGSEIPDFADNEDTNNSQNNANSPKIGKGAGPTKGVSKSCYCVTCGRPVPLMASDPPETLRVRKVEPVDFWVVLGDVVGLLFIPFLLELKQIHDMLLNGCFWLGGTLLTLLLMSLTSQVRLLRKFPKEIRETLAQGYKTDGYLTFLAKSRGLWGFLVLGVTSYGFQWQVEQADQLVGAVLVMIFLIYRLTTYLFELVFLRLPASSYLQSQYGPKKDGNEQGTDLE
jgi:hypothetical protein